MEEGYGTSSNTCTHTIPLSHIHPLSHLESNIRKMVHQCCRQAEHNRQYNCKDHIENQCRTRDIDAAITYSQHSGMCGEKGISLNLKLTVVRLAYIIYQQIKHCIEHCQQYYPDAYRHYLRYVLCPTPPLQL